MKIAAIICLTYILGISQVFAQYRHEITNEPPNDAIKAYMSEAKEYAVIYNGKEQTPYPARLTNHPYLNTQEYKPGTLCYNNIIYNNVLIRLDLFRQECMVLSPDKPFNIVLEYEKFNYAVINGEQIIPSTDVEWKNIPAGRFLALLYNNKLSVIKKYDVSYKENINRLQIEGTFKTVERYFVCKDGICYPVKSKSSLLKLFPDKKKELDTYAKQNKLNFGSKREEAIIAITQYYENLIQ